MGETVKENREVGVDLKGVIAYCMVKWKWVLLLVLIFSILAGGIGSYRKSHQKTETAVSYQEKLEKAAGALSMKDAAYTEQVCAQYIAYGNKLNEWNAYLKKSLLQELDPGAYVKCDLQYTVRSDSSDAIDALASSLLGYDEYDKIAKSMGKPELSQYINELIYITSVADIGTTEIIQGSAQSSVLGEAASEDDYTYHGIMSIILLAEEEDQLQDMQGVIDEAIETKVREMQDSNTRIALQQIDRVITKNDAKWLLNEQQTATAPLITLQTNRSNFVKNTVETLSEPERNYFDLLLEEKTDDEAQEVAPKPSGGTNLKKYVVAGGMGGIVLALLLLYLAFAFSGKLCTSAQITGDYGLHLFRSIRIPSAEGPMGKADVIRNQGLKMLSGCDANPYEEDAAAFSAELSSMMKKASAHKLFIACDESLPQRVPLLRELVEKLGGEGMEVSLRDPLGSGDAYRALIGSDAVVIVVNLNKTEQKQLNEQIAVCNRNDITVMGCISVFEDRNF